MRSPATCPTSSPQRSASCSAGSREIRALGNIGRVHVCRWGDGGEHLHWWFLARPARVPQLIGSFAAIWDDILPPVPEDVWRADLERLATALRQ
jgi:hypothetical protein